MNKLRQPPPASFVTMSETNKQKPLMEVRDDIIGKGSMEMVPAVLCTKTSAEKSLNTLSIIMKMFSDV